MLGKIFGKVTDEQTNEPLAGVNVVIKNTGKELQLTSRVSFIL